MKNFTAIIFSLLILVSNYAYGSYVNINTIVLGVSLDPDEDHYQFPCVVGPADVVLCGGNISIEDSDCSNSLNYKNVGVHSVDISCRLSDGQNVVLARAEGNLTVDSTQDAFGFVNLKINPAVTLKTVSDSRARVKYLLIVK